MQKRAWAIALAMVMSACDGSESEEAGASEAAAEAREGEGGDAVRLAPIASCEALGEKLRGRMLQEMRARLATERRRRGPFVGCIRDAGVPWGADGCRSCGPVVPVPATAGEPSSVSRTNNQVEGVDEADMVKAVGRWLYVATPTGLHVLEAWPAAETREVARVQITGTPRQLLVEDGRVLVYSAVGNPSRAACTYGYECDFLGDGTKTHLTVLDVSTPSAPRMVRELDLSGSLIAARRIGSTVHTVVAEPETSLPLRYQPYFSSCNPDPDAVEEAFATLERENTALIQQADLSTLLPRVRDSQSADATLDCSGFIAPTHAAGGSYTSVLSFDLTASAPVTNTTVIGRPGAVYVSDHSLYMAVRTASESEASVVHRFRVGAQPADTRYEASGVVPGHALNQFAMDEYEGHLRIATTTGRAPDPKASSTFSILAQRRAALEVVGQVGQIAPSEDIRSVRFAGPRGYVVTFKKTDPLFVVDLADPRAPKLLGELKIPGFSTYMHPLDERNLLTIGYDAEDQGDFAFFQGVLLQIFDVGDPAQPRLRHKAVIGTRGSSSEALTNHLAFNYFADKQLLAVPMTICQDGQGGGNFGQTMTFSGLMLFDVDLTKGIVERGRVAHPPLANGEYDDASCSNWWTNATSNVKRSVFMDDFVYSIAPDVVRVQSLNALGRDVASVRLAP